MKLIDQYQDIELIDALEERYLAYALTTIMDRALPDSRDGLKPVHRRILYGMKDLGLESNKSYKKSARVVGDVMGKFHPHGDTALYEALVRMAQDFSLRYPLVDGQGNFGSIDGDPAAAMRYTEVKLAKVTSEILEDIDKDTVDFQPNYDDTLNEPTVLPSKFPNLLVNGSSGIAVGMATNMAPHNLTEVIDGTIHYIDNNDCSVEDLMQFIKAPDFPTGGIIYGYQGVKSAFETGKGRVIIRAKASIEINDNEKDQIIVSEIPYMVNKSSMIKQTADLVNNKKLDGIADIRDESDRNGMRIVIEIKKDIQGDVVLNQLWRHTRLQTSFPVNMLALDNGQPKQMGLIEILKAFIDFRFEVVTRRTKFLLNKSRNRAHILAGLMVAITSIDEVIELIKASSDPDNARKELCAKSWPAKEVEHFIKLRC